MRCPQCGYGMVAQRATCKRANGERYYTLYYQCGQFANKGSAVCKANSVRADYAEQEIMGRVQRLLGYPRLIDDLTASINEKRTVDRKPMEQELKLLNKEMADIERRKDKYLKLYEEDVLDPKELKDRINVLSEIRQQLEQQQSSIQKQLSMNNTAPVSVEMINDLLASFNAIFGNINPEKRKQLVHTLIKEITVTADRKIDQIKFLINTQQKVII